MQHNQDQSEQLDLFGDKRKQELQRIIDELQSVEAQENLAKLDQAWKSMQQRKKHATAERKRRAKRRNSR